MLRLCAETVCLIKPAFRSRLIAAPHVLRFKTAYSLISAQQLLRGEPTKGCIPAFAHKLLPFPCHRRE